MFEITNFDDLFLWIVENIGWFDVSMNDAGFKLMVDLSEPGNYLAQDQPNSFL